MSFPHYFSVLTAMFRKNVIIYYIFYYILSVFVVVLSGSAVIGLLPLPCEQNRENAWGLMDD